MFDFNSSIFKLENRGKWYNYIYTLNQNSNINLKDPVTSGFTKYYNQDFKSDENILLLANDYNFKKSLFIFWRMIANNLDNNVWFRIGFKISLKVINSDSNLVSQQGIIIIRTISPVQNYNK